MQYSKEQIKQLIQAEAVKRGLDPNMAVAQLTQESGLNVNAVSSAGARGIAQFMPATAKQYGVDVTDVRSSIDGWGRYMSKLKNQFGNEDDARAAYNWGEGNMSKYLKGNRTMPTETKNYNKSIYAIAGRDGDAGYSRQNTMPRGGTVTQIASRDNPMQMMANYQPRRQYAPQPSMEQELLSNPAQYAKKSYLDDMIASVPQQDPYMADLEKQLTAMFDNTEILPKEYMNG